MNAQPGRRGNRFIAALIVGYGAWWLLDNSGPILHGSGIKPVPALAGFVLAACALAVVADSLRVLGNLLDWMKARTPRGQKGTARWARSLRELGKDIQCTGWGPYFGTFKGKEIIADFASNALTVGTAGSGKGIGVIQPTALTIRASKTIIDFKGELSCVLADALRKRGERVRILNIGDMWADILGASDKYNPLHIITDDFQRPSGLQDITDDIDEMCLQFLPESENSGKDDNKYFRDGSRNFIGFAIQTCVLIDGPDATPGDVALMLNDRKSLLQHALWACGRLAQKGSGS